MALTTREFDRVPGRSPTPASRDLQVPRGLGGSKRLLEEFIQLCRRMGGDPLRSQASGGNVSIKLDKTRLIIKQSGARLRQVTRDRGWMAFDAGPLRDFLARLPADRPPSRRQEAAYARVLRSLGPTSRGRPSLESGLHCLLQDRYVIHEHSVTGILLGLMGASQAAALAADCLGGGLSTHFLPPLLPGLHLAQNARKDAQAGPRSGRIGLWFLQNHGILWSSSSLGRLEKAQEAFESRFRRYFGLERFDLPHAPGDPDCRERGEAVSGAARDRRRLLCFCRWPLLPASLRAMTPDFAVYFDQEGGAGGLSWVSDRTVRVPASGEDDFQDKKEVLYMNSMVTAVASERGFLHYLPAGMAREVRSLETERGRFHVQDGLARKAI